MATKLVLATNNKGKIKEFKSLAADQELECEILSLADFPQMPELIEDGRSFKENAAKKAVSTAQATGMTAVADDSGLEVDHLGGAPGIHSSRFGGEIGNDDRNIEKLLFLMEGVPWEQRTARFKCVIAVVTVQMETYFTEGVCEGVIAEEPAGEEGFGYDPVFFLPEYNKTMAQLSPELKNQISHRAKAFQKAVTIIKELI